MKSASDASCVEVVEDNTIIITPPASLMNFIVNQKSIRSTFKRVFKANVTQQVVFDVVAQPLVNTLMDGKNSLLFTYGMTSSGKTYTMVGESGNDGLMIRCTKLLFARIRNQQVERFVFKPDRVNGFKIQYPDRLINIFKETPPGM